ncbi:MAG: asparagine--tRNA ligase [Desulfovibrio sp.]|jgi:asparaginyl-tRNA synthetase|nr:asparagine--tRNA ligase [Desulfovibrio sp.]
MRRILIADALAADAPRGDITICGWVRTRRDLAGCSFLELNDGSSLSGMQCVVEHAGAACAALGGVNTGAALQVDGALVPSPGKGQRWEVLTRAVTVFGLADPQIYPLQKKRHSDEFLRGIAHLRARTNKYGAAFRLRSQAARAVHEFFHERRFTLVHTPVLTGADCEGAGEMFRVAGPTDNGDGRGEEFFHRPCRLTVSGQLEAEALAMGLGRVYTFGPVFRAENSNTPRHAAEFWMIEPEMAFADLHDTMELGEELIRHVIERVLARCRDELGLFDAFVDKGLVERLAGMTAEPFARVPYAEAVRILEAGGKDFVYPVVFGMDLQTEHERYLAGEHFRRPVIVYDYPREIKPFYMRVNDDNETVAAMDILVPRVGELAGGSQREERLERLGARIAELGQNPADYWWYLDLRRFGSAPHAGFGLGFERLLMLLTGMGNIRDVLPFPRTPGNLEF